MVAAVAATALPCATGARDGIHMTIAGSAIAAALVAAALREGPIA